MTDDERLAQWNAWLDVIYAEVQSLMVSRHVYRRVQEIIAANPAIQQSSSFYDCYATEHAAYAAMAIRRSLDTDKQAISLARLLDSISKFPKVLSRERYVGAITGRGYSASYGESGFDDLVGIDQKHVDPEKVKAELEELQRLGDSCKAYTDRRIAHTDKRPPEKLPTFPEIDACIEHIETVVKRYLLLIRQVCQFDILPTWMYDWEEIFRKPWLPPLEPEDDYDEE